MLRLLDLHRYFEAILAVDGVSLTIPEGEICALIGPNGAGKTTLFNLLTGYLKPDRGEIIFRGQRLTGKSPYEIARMGIGRTFQDLRLIQKLTALENVMLSFPKQLGESVLGALAGQDRRQKNAIKKQAQELLELVGIKEKAVHLAGELSYGEQKLLTLACCLALGARLILLDEPVAGVNPELIEKILELLLYLREKEGKTILLIEHNIDAVMHVSDRVIAMDEGRIIADGLPQEVRKHAAVVESYLE